MSRLALSSQSKTLLWAVLAVRKVTGLSTEEVLSQLSSINEFGHAGLHLAGYSFYVSVQTYEHQRKYPLDRFRIITNIKVTVNPLDMRRSEKTVNPMTLPGYKKWLATVKDI